MIVELFGGFGWEWTTQSANMSLFKVMNAVLFPELAKGVSKIQVQELFYKGRSPSVRSPEKCLSRPG